MHRLFTALIACAAVALLTPARSHAQGYPDRPVKLVVPYVVGGPVDTSARTVSEKLTETLGQSVVIENRTGAGGTIGTNYVAKSVADGYTLLFGVAGALALAPSLYAKLPYDPAADFAPVALIAFYPNALLISRNAPFKSVKELIAAARAKPGGFSYATGGSGTMQHLSAVLFTKMANIKLVHIPYKGGFAAMPDVLAGRVPILFGNIGLAVPYANSDKIAVLALTGTAKSRSPILPNVPTLAEAADFPGYETYEWSGILAPAGTPQAVVEHLHRAITSALQSPALAKKLAEQGAEHGAKTPAEFGDFIRSEKVKWREFIKSTDVRLD